MIKKLIEVALPLEAINREAEHEKSVPRKGHPATLHLWWARRPLAACRAVLFASIVDDPSSHPEKFPTEEDQDHERERLFRIIGDLVKWENSNNERVLEAAREEIRRATGGKPPPVLDPFCGGGSIPLEAQRLGLEVHASDLNPVAALITKALIEIPPRFAGKPPINPEARKAIGHSGSWRGTEGLAEDVRYYGQWMRGEAVTRIGPLYPKIKLPTDHRGNETTVVAWLWARTIRCPNPACGAEMPLVRSFALSVGKGKEAHVEPIVSGNKYRFAVEKGGKAEEGTVNRSGARCICCGSPVPFDHVRAEGRAGRLGARLMAIVGEGRRRRVYLPPNDEHERIAKGAEPEWVPDTQLPTHALGFRVQAYGMTRHSDLFTQRQLLALTTFSDLVGKARKQVFSDARAAGLPADGSRLEAGGDGAAAYADAVATYLAFAVDKLADWSSTICGWMPPVQKIRDTFARQAIPMTWDFAEINPFSESVGNFGNHVAWVSAVITTLNGTTRGSVSQLDARSLAPLDVPAIASTDPPYYDNIGYSDLSDFFYIWLRRSVGELYPSLFATLLTPKTEELIASPYRFGGNRIAADAHFETGLGIAFQQMRRDSDQRFPMTVFYAFKQAEDGTEGDGTAVVASTGWETMLEGLLSAGLSVEGTWPIRTERGGRSVSVGTNALASSVVIVSRQRDPSAALASRREFLAALKDRLPNAIARLQRSSIAPVDLAQAAIGPGMAIFSAYSKVLEADGLPMRVRAALGLVNQVLDEILAHQEGEFDSDTRWSLAWFEQYRFDEGPFGVAETLSKAKNTSVRGLEDAGILNSKAGKVRLLRREELDGDWNPKTDRRLTLWEIAQHLVHRHESGGEAAASELLREVGSGMGEAAKDLAYRLYQICDRKGWSSEAQPYNALVVAWPEISRLASAGPAPAPAGELFE